MRRLRIGDRLVRLRDEGESQKLPVAFLHGAGGSSVVWMDAVRRLSPRRRIFAPDLPGHGQSDRLATDLSIPAYRDFVGALCEALAVPRVILAGHSMGGQIALACAAAWPERVGGLVLIASGARLEVGPRVLEVMEKDWARAPSWLGKRAWSPSTPRELVQRWGNLTLSASQEVTLADFRAVERFDGRPLLGAVRAPTLVVSGEDDLLAPPAASQAVAQAIPWARVEELQHAGHMLMLEQPDAFFRALDPFLATLA